MQCNCVADTVHRQHTVKRLEKALEWCDEAKAEDLPITICRDECTSCGRQLIQPYKTGENDD